MFNFKFDFSFLSFDLYQEAKEIIKKCKRNSCLQFHNISEKWLKSSEITVKNLNPILESINENDFNFLFLKNAILSIKHETIVVNHFRLDSSNSRKVQVLDPLYYILTLCIFLYLIKKRKNNIEKDLEQTIKSFSNSDETYGDKMSLNYESKYREYKECINQQSKKYKFRLEIDIKKFYLSISKENIFESIEYFHQGVTKINIWTIINFLELININKNFILPILNDNHLTSYLSCHVFLKKILIEFLKNIGKKEYSEIFLINWMDDIKIFANDENLLKQIFYKLKKFLRDNFPNIEMNLHKINLVQSNKVMDIKPSLYFSSDEFRKDLSLNEMINIFAKIKSFFNNLKFNDTLDLLNSFNKNNEQELDFQNLIFSIKKFDENQITEIYNIIEEFSNEELELFIKFNIKKSIEFLSKLNIENKSKKNGKWGIKFIWNYINLKNANEFNYIDHHDLILYYSLNKTFKHIDTIDIEKINKSRNDIETHKLINFYKSSYKNKYKNIISIFSNQNEKIIDDISIIFKYYGNFIYYISKKDYILGITQFSSLIEHIGAKFYYKNSYDKFLKEVSKKNLYNKDIQTLINDIPSFRNNFLEIHKAKLKKDKSYLRPIDIKNVKELIQNIVNNFDLFLQLTINGKNNIYLSSL